MVVIKRVGFGQIRAVAFTAKRHLFGMALGASQSDEDDSDGSLELRVDLKDEVLRFRFETSCSVLRKLNPFVELLMRIRELNE